MTEGEEEPRSRARWFGAGLIVVGLVAAVVAAYDAGGPPPGDAAAPPVRPAWQSLGNLLATPEVPLRSAPKSALAMPVTSRVSSAVPPGQAEVCGLGRIAVDEHGLPEDPGLLQAPLTQARERMALSLANSGREGERAAGLFMQALGVQQTFAASEPASAPASGAAAAPPLDVAAIDALASMAVASPSPQVYALAMAACERRGNVGVCQMLSAAQWARIDPGNAVPWIHAANQASRRRDEAGVSDALFHLVHATTSDTRVLPIVGMAVARLPADTPAYVSALLANEQLSTAFSTIPPYNALTRHCDAKAQADTNRQQLCSGVAEMLTTRSGSLIELAVGMRIGERAGWPPERLQALQNERDAIGERAAEAMRDMGGAQPLGCAAVERLVRYTREIASRGGEAAALRQGQGQSPEQIAALAQRYRERAARAAPDAVAGPASSSSP